FDTPKQAADNALDNASQSLKDLVEDIEFEEHITIVENGGDDPETEDNVDGWVDEVAMLTEEWREELLESIRPIKLILVKLRKIAFKIVHSTTLLLPAWEALLEELEMSVRLMPRDMATRWNSTFDMLDFALEYRGALDKITDRVKLGLGSFSMNEH
ncbi:hypothetical protein BV22DRAFT_1022769, partial [Leucogyrophana mollusca]